jgi:hypothetical protein
MRVPRDSFAARASILGIAVQARRAHERRQVTADARNEFSANCVGANTVAFRTVLLSHITLCRRIWRSNSDRRCPAAQNPILN